MNVRFVAHSSRCRSHICRTWRTEDVWLVRGHGLKGTAGWLESIGIKPGMLMAFLAALSEIVGGLLFAAGLWLPIAAALIVLTMLVAIFTVHGKNGYWVTQNGFEYNLILIAVAIGVALVGPGAYSIHLG